MSLQQLLRKNQFKQNTIRIADLRRWFKFDDTYISSVDSISLLHNSFFCCFYFSSFALMWKNYNIYTQLINILFIVLLFIFFLYYYFMYLTNLAKYVFAFYLLDKGYAQSTLHNSSIFSKSFIFILSRVQ